MINQKQHKKEILVSISCITFNHVNYIKDAIEGFLMQKTDFDFEILIHDDASTDGTTEIIKEYEKKYPRIFKPIYQKENQWSKGVKISTKYNFPRAKGKYIAICEGDDYWTDPYKLQKQVDFLEKNSTVGLVGTHTTNLYNSSKLQKQLVYFKDSYRIYNFNDFVFGRANISTLTVVVRKRLLLDYINSSFINDILPYDYLIWLFISYKSDIAILRDNTAVYRILDESASHSKNISKIWQFKKELFESTLFLIQNVFTIEPQLKNIMITHKIKERYLLAYNAKDYMFLNYALDIFKQNKNLIRYYLLKISLKYPSFIKLSYIYERLNKNN